MSANSPTVYGLLRCLPVFNLFPILREIVSQQRAFPPEMKLLQWSLPLAILGTLGGALPAADCDKIPSWTFKNLKWHTLDTVGQNGSASFTLVNSVTDKAVDLKCTLVANYRCQIKTDDATEVTLQAQNGVLYVWVDQDLTCGDATV